MLKRTQTVYNQRCIMFRYYYRCKRVDAREAWPDPLHVNQQSRFFFSSTKTSLKADYFCAYENTFIPVRFGDVPYSALTI